MSDDLRGRMFNAVAPALGGFFVPLSRRQAVADALLAIARAELSPVRPDGTHNYVSTACACSGDKVMEDGRTGHQYCQSMTGYQGAKRGGRAKCCDAPCQCSCHSAAPDCRWPACLSEADQQLLADQVSASERGEVTVPMPDPRPGCGCVDRGLGESLRTYATGGEQPRCPHCQMPHDLVGWPAEVCRRMRENGRADDPAGEPMEMSADIEEHGQ